MKRFFCIGFLLLAAAAADAGWTRVPIYGGDVTALAVDPFQAGTLFCGTSRGNVYFSSDGGRNWDPTRPGNQFPGYVVSTIVCDVARPGVLWAALSGEERGALLAQSPDRGITWRIVARWERSVNARAFAQSAENPDFLAAGGDDGVFLSRDGGTTWAASGYGVGGLALVQSLAFAPHEKETLFAGTYRQAFRTRDGGKTWTRIAAGMVLDATIYSFDFEPASPSHLWVSTCGWVYRSVDSGDHWVRLTTGFTNRRSPVMKLDPTRAGVLYAGTVGGLHRSDDGGHTWRLVSRDTLDVSALAIDPRNGRLFVGSLGEGMFYSDDAGDTLERGSGGLEEARIPAVAVDPDDPGRLVFLRAYGGIESGVWELLGGRAAQISRAAPPGAFVLAAGRGASGTIWLCASASTLLVSRDGARSFAPPKRPPPGRILGLFGDPLDQPLVLTESGVYSSADGDTFTPVAGIPGAARGARVVRRPGGGAVLEVEAAGGRYLGSASGFSESRRPVLSGGMFVSNSPDSVQPDLRVDVRGAGLMLERGSEQALLPLPRVDMSVSGAVITADGSLYVATMGDGLLRYQAGDGLTAVSGLVDFVRKLIPAPGLRGEVLRESGAEASDRVDQTFGEAPAPKVTRERPGR